ncbi:serine/threonine-protein kinase 10-like [Anopheles marshallii]|uniref:serine/threonine-protein kinase 10-like n=1 Tax=Anopheles marshallii TaxID=1521116 RepID=UPI00237C4A18|nr:serine/threonine-protein kinase 10-like [Anopheles marshallii]
MDNTDQEIDTKQEELRHKKQEKLLAKKTAAQKAQNQLYRDHLNREREFSVQTEKTFFAGWETLCSQVRSDQLAEELRQQKQCFGTVFDRKNEIIQRLVGVRDEVQEIHTKCLARLGNVIDYYIRLKDYLTATMLKHYETEAQNLLKDFREEVESKESFSCSQMEELDASLAELLSKMKQDKSADREWLLESNNQNISAQVEKCEIIRDKKYAEMSALYRRLRATLDSYFQTVLYRERKQSYDRLVYYTELEQQAIEQRRCQVAVLQMKKTQLDHTLTLTNIGERRKLRTRHNYRRLLEMKVQLLKEQQKQLDVEHHQCMKKICSFTHHLKNVLTEHLAWGNRIAKLGLICTQYETEQDQKYAAKWLREDGDDSNALGHNELDDLFGTLTNKINRIEAFNIIYREERTRLKIENNDLKTKFKAYCELHKITNQEKLLLCSHEVVAPGQRSE